MTWNSRYELMIRDLCDEIYEGVVVTSESLESAQQMVPEIAKRLYAVLTSQEALRRVNEAWDDRTNLRNNAFSPFD